MTTIEIKLSLSDELLDNLKREATRRAVSLDVIVSETLAEYYREPGDDDILDGIRKGMKQALSGDHRPAHTVLDEIEDGD